MRLAFAIVVPSFLVLACGSSAPQPAEHPSAAQHDAIAQENEAAAQEHLRAANAPPTVNPKCAKNPKTGEWWSCWTPTPAAQRAEAEDHLRMARAHRAVSQAMRDAEAKACEGVSDEDRDVSPFSHVTDILHVEPLGTTHNVDGARVVFTKLTGLSRGLLQKIIDCHIARADAMGHVVPEEAFCPLILPNVTAVVREAPSGFVVDVTSDDPKAAQEVLHRATLLKPR